MLGRNAQVFTATHHQRHAACVLHHHAHFLPFHQSAQIVLDLLDRHAQTACRLAVDVDAVVLHAAVLGRDHILAARQGLQGLHDLTGQATQFVGIGAKNLHRQIAAHARQHFGGAHFNGLGEAQVHAGNAFGGLTDGVDEFGLGLEAPLFARLQHQKAVGLIEPHGVQAQFVRTHPGHNAFDLGHRLQNASLQGQVGGRGLLQVDGRELFHLHDDVALIERRHEGLADERKQRQRTRQRQQ